MVRRITTRLLLLKNSELALEYMSTILSQLKLKNTHQLFVAYVVPFIVKSVVN
jgi:hypothetical protein